MNTPTAQIARNSRYTAKAPFPHTVCAPRGVLVPRGRCPGMLPVYQPHMRLATTGAKVCPRAAHALYTA